MGKPKIFISYSHEDEEWRKRLVSHLGVLQLQNLLDFWTDKKIGIGEVWFAELEDAINTATAAILLVSVDFLNSPFILREEIGRLLKRREEEGLPIFPILVRPCAWDEVPWLARLQIRPQDMKGRVMALASHNDRHGAQVDEHLVAIVKEIKAKVLGPAAPPEGPSQPKLSKVTRQEITNSIGMEFVLIPAGEFRMGSEYGRSDEKPVRRVQISKPFYLGKYQVTQEQWQTVMGSNPSSDEGDPKRPVESVSWHEVQDFLRKLAEKETGRMYRLPTEAEWEYACRAGSPGPYCFGDDMRQLKEYVWCDENVMNGTTHPVGQLKPNNWGLYDMHGNVWEWVQDWYAADYYEWRPTPDSDPQGPEEGEYGVLRGGSWYDKAWFARVACRHQVPPRVGARNFGFRCAQ